MQEEGSLRAGARPSPQPLVRQVSAGLEAAVESFQALCGEGKVALISVQSVMDRLGPRWPVRRQQVYEHVERTIDRHLRQQGFQLRVGETDFLIAQPELGRLTGQATALRCLREILTHFLGDGDLAELGVLEVLEIGRDGLLASPIDPRAAEAAESADREAAISGAEPAVAGPVRSWLATFVARGLELQVASSWSSLLDVRTRRIIGLRMASQVGVLPTIRPIEPAELARLTPADLVAILDLGFDLNVGRLQEAVAAKSVGVVAVGLPCTAVNTSRGRAAVMSMLRECRRLAGRGLVTELQEVADAPHGSLVAAASIARPYSILVTANYGEACPRVRAPLHEAQVGAVSLEVPVGLSTAERVKWMRRQVAAARALAPRVLVHGLRSEEEIEVSFAAGASLASLPKASDALGEGERLVVAGHAA